MLLVDDNHPAERRPIPDGGRCGGHGQQKEGPSTLFRSCNPSLNVGSKAETRRRKGEKKKPVEVSWVSDRPIRRESITTIANSLTWPRAAPGAPSYRLFPRCCPIPSPILHRPRGADMTNPPPALTWPAVEKRLRRCVLLHRQAVLTRQIGLYHPPSQQPVRDPPFPLFPSSCARRTGM